jgi:hypothetical protein
MIFGDSGQGHVSPVSPLSLILCPSVSVRGPSLGRDKRCNTLVGWVADAHPECYSMIFLVNEPHSGLLSWSLGLSGSGGEMGAEFSHKMRPGAVNGADRMASDRAKRPCV